MTIDSQERRAAGKRPLQLSRLQATLAFSIFAVVWATGAWWIVLHRFFPVHGEFGATPHPMEKWALASHGAAAFAVLWLAGALWTAHVVPAWKKGFRSPSGLAVIVILGALVVSGYLLYYLGDDVLRARMMLIHWIVGIASPLPLIVHIAYRRRRMAG